MSITVQLKHELDTLNTFNSKIDEALEDYTIFSMNYYDFGETVTIEKTGGSAFTLNGPDLVDRKRGLEFIKRIKFHKEDLEFIVRDIDNFIKDLKYYIDSLNLRDYTIHGNSSEGYLRLIEDCPDHYELRIIGVV